MYSRLRKSFRGIIFPLGTKSPDSRDSPRLGTPEALGCYNDLSGLLSPVFCACLEDSKLRFCILSWKRSVYVMHSSSSASKGSIDTTYCPVPNQGPGGEQSTNKVGKAAGLAIRSGSQGPPLAARQTSQNIQYIAKGVYLKRGRQGSQH